MTPRVSLRVTAGPIAGRVFSFAEHDTFLFGRAPDCHAQLAESDATASRHHFLLEVNPPAARLRDLGSLNGTHVNGVRHGGRARDEPAAAADRALPSVDLRDGDRIRVGHTEFAVAIEGAEAQPAAVPTPAPAHTPTPAPAEGGPLVIGDYDVGRLLGRGGMGSVHLARRRSDGAVFALKVMLPHVVVEEGARESFLREIEVTRALEHPAIVRLHDHGRHGEGFFFAMDYCAGGSVHGLLKDSSAALPPALAVRMALRALEGLAHAHERGFIHRDLKPENLLVDDHDGSGVRITDFGLAKSFQQAGFSGMTATGAVAGTLSFMPREQLTNFRLVRPVSDVWSLAATLYFMLTRQFARDFGKTQDPLQAILRGGTVPIQQRDPRLPGPLARVIDRALLDDVRQRYPTAAAFHEALLRVAPTP